MSFVGWGFGCLGVLVWVFGGMFGLEGVWVIGWWLLGVWVCWGFRDFEGFEGLRGPGKPVDSRDRGITVEDPG